MVSISIQTLAHGGEAVGRLPDGRVAFVPLGCPGDTITATITAEKDRWVRATIDEIVEPSPRRVTPECPYFGVCGGCQWQHVAYDLQVSEKHRTLADALSRIGHLDLREVRISDTVPSASHYGYRNKVDLQVVGRETTLGVGFHRQGSDEVVDIDTCALLPKKHQRIPRAIRGALRYLSGSDDLGIARVSVRIAHNTPSTEIALWTNPGPLARAVVARTMGDSVKASSIVRPLFKGPYAEKNVTGVEVLAGKGHWHERLGDLDYRISAPSFFQVNSAQAEKLIELVLGAADVDGTDRVLDLYSGAGTFTVPLSLLAGEVVAVESSSYAIADLRRNLDAAGSDADVVGGDAAREVRDLGRFDVVVVDPPRSGLDKSVPGDIAATRAKTVVYVSCDPATLARDVTRFIQAGYRLESATPVDLFPQTYHLETVAVLRRI